VTRRQNRVFIALKLPGPAPALISAAWSILLACRKHTRLKNPTPSLDEIEALIVALQSAQVEKDRGGLGKRTARDKAADDLRQALHALGQCVETQANENIEEAESFITEAGMSVRAASTRRKKPIAAKPGHTPGSVVVEVLAVDDNTVYEWFCSLDGGKTFQVWKRTKQSKATLEGLPSGVDVHIYCLATGRDGVPRKSETIVFHVK
jgi:hypothetical protein